MSVEQQKEALVKEIDLVTKPSENKVLNMNESLDKIEFKNLEKTEENNPIQLCTESSIVFKSSLESLDTSDIQNNDFIAYTDCILSSKEEDSNAFVNNATEVIAPFSSVEEMPSATDKEDDDLNCNEREEKTVLVDNVSSSDSLKTVKNSNGIAQNTVSKKFLKRKCQQILYAIETEDIEFLRKACVTPGGLVSDELRQTVWPKLLGVDVVETLPRPTQKEVEEHPYYNQVVMDVNRSLQRFPPSIAEAQRLAMLDQLVYLIMRVLLRRPSAHYYQGYHDICVTFLLVVGEEASFHVLHSISGTHLSVFMERTMESTIHLLEHMYTLLELKSPVLHRFLLASEVNVGFCLAWLITWFGHMLKEYSNVVRLFDLFLVSHPWMPLYLTTVIVLHQEEEVLKLDCDMASVHQFLSQVSDELPFEELIEEACELFNTHTPDELDRARPFIPKSSKKKGKWNLLGAIVNKINRPTLIIASAVVISAVIYQAYYRPRIGVELDI